MFDFDIDIETVIINSTSRKLYFDDSHVDFYATILDIIKTPSKRNSVFCFELDSEYIDILTEMYLYKKGLQF